MAFGVLPVIISDDWVLPFEEIIDWPALSIRVRDDDTELLRIPKRLAAMPLDSLCKMRGHAYDIYHQFLRSPKEWSEAMAKVLEHRRVNTDTGFRTIQ
jgi:hypothetical protein